MAALLVPVLCGDCLQGRDTLWFVDNETIISSMIRVTSRAEDGGHVAAMAQIALCSESI